MEKKDSCNGGHVESLSIVLVVESACWIILLQVTPGPWCMEELFRDSSRPLHSKQEERSKSVRAVVYLVKIKLFRMIYAWAGHEKYIPVCWSCDRSRLHYRLTQYSSTFIFRFAEVWKTCTLLLKTWHRVENNVAVDGMSCVPLVDDCLERDGHQKMVSGHIALRHWCQAQKLVSVLLVGSTLKQSHRNTKFHARYKKRNRTEKGHLLPPIVFFQRKNFENRKPIKWSKR